MTFTDCFLAKNFLRLPILSLVFLTIFSACSGDPGSNSGSSSGGESPGIGQTASTPATADSRPAIYLDGLYATSAAPGKSAAGLFDSDPSTTWQTQGGAGPDEGIMLYFSDRQQVSVASVEVVDDGSSFTGNDASIQLYVNGQLDNSGKANSKISLEPLRGGEALRSLYVRFAKTGRETSTEKTSPEGKTILSSYPKNASISLKDIKLYGSNGQALRIEPPRRVRGSVSATSTLAPEAAYNGSNLFDSRKEFVWVEGNAGNSGEGESLTFEFSEPVNITAIKIWNGYQRSKSHFSANARAKTVQFGEKGGLLKDCNLADREAGQKIEVSPAAKGKIFELKIKDVFRGSKYKDLAISDLVFFDGDKPFVLQTSLPEKFENDLRNQVANSPVANLLNRRVSNEVLFASMEETNSIILRSDGTFVLYSEVSDEGIQTKTVADGNWEIVEANASSAKIKVFGKIYDLSTIVEYYKGNSESEVTKIFSDVLSVDAEKIRGGKVLGTFWLK